MSRPSGGIGTVLAMVLVAAAVCGSAYGAGVQVSLAPSANADTVLRYISGAFTTPSISWDNNSPGGGVDNWMVTQSAASQLASIQDGSNPVGLNDNGFYPASGARLYDVQLGYNATTATGTNTAIRSTTAGSFSLSIPNGQYSQFAIFGSGGSGSSSLNITLTYSTGSPTTLSSVTLPDWYSGSPSTTAAGAAGTYFALTPALSRQAAYDFPNAGYQAPSGGAYVYGINLAPDSTRVLTSVAVAYTPASPGYTVANFLGAAGATVAATSTPSATVPALGTWGMVLLAVGLVSVCWLFVRREGQAR